MILVLNIILCSIDDQNLYSQLKFTLLKYFFKGAFIKISIMAQLAEIVQTTKVLNGRWTKSEHDRFMTAFEKFGRNWV